MISLAGQLAVIRLRGCRGKQVLGKSDLEGLDHTAAHAGERLNTYLDRLAARTAQYLDLYWAHIVALADALLDRRKLSGKQVTDILRNVQSPPLSPI
jgi:ATP-dependent Zn protease